MIDYAEGYLELKASVEDLWQALMRKNYTEAREICDKIVVSARVTRAQIGAQFNNEP